MKDFSRVFGNEKLRARLAADIRNGSMAHAYIIEGKKGCGKHTLALELSAALSCENKSSSDRPLPCGVCSSCKKILSGNSPDVITVSREDGKVQMGVDVIRELRENVRLKPNDLDTKVYIIEDSHTMRIEAQNAFLLTLEEPPQFVKFFLLCENSGMLLDTVKSRAPIIRMTPLDMSMLKEKLLAVSEDAVKLKNESEKEFEEVVKLSSGHLGQALELLDKNARKPKLEARSLAAEFVSFIGERKSGKRMNELIGAFSKKRDELIYQLSEIEKALRDLILLKKSDDATLCFFTADAEASELAYRLKISTLLSVMEAVGRAKTRISANGNVRLTLFALAVDCGLL